MISPYKYCNLLALHSSIHNSLHNISLSQARHAKMDALAEEKGTSAGVIKLVSVVALDGLHRGAVLCRGVGNEGRESVESVRFNTKRKSPQIMRAIIKNDQLIFITRYTDDWRCP
jgi:hypothetical protein